MHEKHRRGEQDWLGARATKAKGTYHRRERLASGAEDKREARTKTSARIADTLPRGQHGALYALEQAVGDRRVDGKHETGFEAEPEARDALLAHDLPRDAEEGVVVLLPSLAGLALALGRSQLLARGDDRNGDGEDLRECAGNSAQCELSDG